MGIILTHNSDVNNNFEPLDEDWESSENEESKGELDNNENVVV